MNNYLMDTGLKKLPKQVKLEYPLKFMKKTDYHTKVITIKNAIRKINSVLIKQHSTFDTYIRTYTHTHTEREIEGG